MTYGVYNRDMQSASRSGLYSIEACKEYLRDDTDVVCSERQKWCALVVKFIFHKWRGFHRYDDKMRLGFVSIETHSNYYTWADKIVYDPKMEGGAK